MDIPVLKYLDVLIGLAFTMVLLSTIVLAITQVILNSSWARPRHLKLGLIRLIVQLDPETMRPHADYLARLFLRHPMVGQQTVFSKFRYAFQRLKLISWTWMGDQADENSPTIVPAASPGACIQREELAYLIIELAAGDGPLLDPLELGTTPRRLVAAQAALAAALRRDGVEDPAATLRAIRVKMVENERTQPDLTACRWRANAIADSAPSDFIGKLHATFDNTIARVTDAFSGESKIWASVVALIVAVTLQVDSFALVKRLTINDADRQAFVDAAVKFTADRDKAATETERKEKQAAVDDANQALALLAAPALKLVPATGPINPIAAFSGRAGPDVNTRWPGVLFTWVLVSLGAPFWFDLLKNLLKLRSLIAKQDDEERKARQEAASKEAAKKEGSQKTELVPNSAGEVGDLTATGAIG